jgi:AbrB family looped-hinge helix DNA binding protein
MSEMTRVSTKGQIVIPKAMRDRLKWAPGTELVVEDTPSGITIRKKPLFRPTTIEEVAGSLKYDGQLKSIADMDEAIGQYLAEKHARR